jgi:hypothetical protein
MNIADKPEIANRATRQNEEEMFNKFAVENTCEIIILILIIIIY